MLPNVGTWELIIIILVVFLVFGSKRLPEIAAGIGKGVRAFKREMQGVTDELERPANSTSSQSPPGVTRQADARTPPSLTSQHDAPQKPTDDEPAML